MCIIPTGPPIKERFQHFAVKIRLTGVVVHDFHQTWGDIMKKIFLIVLLGAMPSGIFAQGQSGNNAKPFQELEEAIDAAIAAEASAREAGDAANSAEVAAEAAAREAADAAALAAIAAERLERIEADEAMQAKIDEHELLFGSLDNRVSVLEGLHFGRSITWTETTGTFDVVNLAGAIAALNAQPGEWVLVVGNYSGYEWGICTNNSRVHTWLSQATSDLEHSYSTYFPVYMLVAGNWLSNMQIRLISAAWDATPDWSRSKYIRVAYPYYGSFTYDIALSERFGDSTYIDNEVIVDYSGNGGTGIIGNTVTLRVGAERMTACGF
jgi:hypothetical protein